MAIFFMSLAQSEDSISTEKNKIKTFASATGHNVDAKINTGPGVNA